MKKQGVNYCFLQKAGTNIHQIYIYDDIKAYSKFNWETWSYEESETSAQYFREQLQNIPETDEIELHINSSGGSVKEGIAIYNQLKQHKAKKTCYIDGYAHSVASVIALSCDHIVMGLGTSMLIHNMWIAIEGNAKQLRKAADDLDTLMDANRQIYLARSKNLTEEKLIEMMENETFLTPEQCLEYGFCDEIGTDTADENVINESLQSMIQQLNKSMQQQKSLKDEIMLMQKNMKVPDGDVEQVPHPTIKEKTMKLMSALNNAVTGGLE